MCGSQWVPNKRYYHCQIIPFSTPTTYNGFYFCRSKSSPTSKISKLQLPLWQRHMAWYISTAYDGMSTFITDFIMMVEEYLSSGKKYTRAFKVLYIKFHFTEDASNNVHFTSHIIYVGKSLFPYPMSTIITTSSSPHQKKKKEKEKEPAAWTKQFFFSFIKVKN